jgi:DNA-binding MarR family transcriptional regulator
MVNNIHMANQTKMAQVHTAIADLQRLTELFRMRRKQLAAGVGLTEHQWSVLEEIATEHFMPSMFARQRQSSPAAVSKTIRQLIDKELVTVSLNSTDGRQRDYVLTSKGKRVIQRLRKNREQAIQQVWLDMSSSRIETFSQIATELNDKLALLVNGQ